MEPISTLGIYLLWIAAGSGALYYYANAESENIHNRLERSITRL